MWVEDLSITPSSWNYPFSKIFSETGSKVGFLTWVLSVQELDTISVMVVIDMARLPELSKGVILSRTCQESQVREPLSDATCPRTMMGRRSRWRTQQQVGRAFASPEADRRPGCVTNAERRLKVCSKGHSSLGRQNGTLLHQGLPASWHEGQIFSWVQGSYVQEYPGSTNYIGGSQSMA